MTVRKVMSALAATLILVLAVAILALWIKPPDLLRVGANYTAKIVCSNVFLAGRDPDEVLHTDVQSPGIALLRLMQVTVDRQQKLVHAGLLGLIGHGLALARPTTGWSDTGVARAKLFNPLGMTSATIETDEDGTLVGSSYMYATARDWARYGQFLLQEGVWQGQALLPAGYVALMATPVAPSGGQYGHGLVWLWGSDALVPGKNPDTAFGIPADSFWMEGHDGQSIAIIPSRQLVIVRLGLTPPRNHYQPQPLVRAILDAAG